MKNYQYFKITQDTTLDDIKAQFREGAFNLHPDRNPQQNTDEFNAMKAEFDQIIEEFSNRSESIFGQLLKKHASLFAEEYIDNFKIPGKYKFFEDLIEQLKPFAKEKAREGLGNIIDTAEKNIKRKIKYPNQS